MVRRQLRDRCWELDAMDPNDLRDCVEQGDQEADRARGVEALRGRQHGRAGIAADDPVEEGAKKRAGPGEPQPSMAATNKCLARSNKPRTCSTEYMNRDLAQRGHARTRSAGRRLVVTPRG